jgi:hypothetical protein
MPLGFLPGRLELRTRTLVHTRSKDYFKADVSRQFIIAHGPSHNSSGWKVTPWTDYKSVSYVRRFRGHDPQNGRRGRDNADQPRWQERTAILNKAHSIFSSSPGAASEIL